MPYENHTKNADRYHKIPVKSDSPKTKTLEIKITLPSSLRKHVTKKRILIFGLICLVVAGLVYWFAVRPDESRNKTLIDSSQVAITDIGKGTPEYSTVLPGEKTIESLGGWTRVSPPKANPVFAYIDSINNTPINVSQQPIPEDFKDDIPGKIESLAQEYGANQKITVGDVAVYIGTSAKGPQSIIFGKDDLLILIKSSVAISNDHWAQYISSLQ